LKIRNKFYNFSEIVEKKLAIKEKKKFSCNCKKSKCLKLYCECFANGELCVDCNCEGCSNELGYEEVIDRVRSGMKLKLTTLSNNMDSENSENAESNQIANDGDIKLGCNCTKSNCNKKYCECYKANIKCTDKCRCRDCNNSQHPHSHFKKKRKNYPYNGYIIEKISVYIRNTDLVIDKFSTLDLFGFANNYFKFDCDKLVLNQVSELPFEIKEESVYNEIVQVKEENNEILLEIPKYIIGTLTKYSTPNINLTKKRKRIKSDNSKPTSANDIIKDEKTCWQTDKKIIRRTAQNLIAKKLEWN
jgi:hypothetical protein